MNNMYHFQSEQISEVYSKNPSNVLIDKLTAALIGLSRAADTNPTTESTDKIIIEGLFSVANCENLNDEDLEKLIANIHEEKFKLVPSCAGCASPCGRTSDYDMKEIRNADEDIRSLKSLILTGISSMAADIYHTATQDCHDPEVNAFFRKALFLIGEDLNAEQLRSVAEEANAVKPKCTGLTDRAESENE